MWKYVLKRIGLALLTSVIILTLTFFLIKLLDFQMPIGNDQAKFAYFSNQVSLGYVVDLKAPSKYYGDLLWEYFDGTRAHYYYQTPLMTQYINWVKNIVTMWNWGTSTQLEPNVNVMTIIGDRLPVTISINIISLIISVPLGIALGIWAALKKNKPTDHAISTGIMVFISIPSFVLITFIMLIFCYNNQWLPSKWPDAAAPLSQKILGYIVPVTSLSFASIAGYARFTRAELCEVMSSEYLLLARTKGLTKSQAIKRHALRNAMVPIVPSILAEFIAVLGGSMVLDNLYTINGMGKLFIDSLGKRDYDVLLGTMAVFTIIGLLAGVLVDISYGFIDPRIRMGAKK